MELEGIDGVYLVSPSLDGRPVGKFVARDSFARVATNGIGLHPLAMTDFRATLWGKPIGFNEDDREGTIVPDPSTFRRLPWQPRLARVFCFYYDTDSGDLRDLDPRGTLARHEHTFVDEVGVNMMVGIEPELMWLRKKENGELEHTVEPFAFYEIAYLEEWEPILLDLIEYGRGMGLPISHADSEDKSQVEVNQSPGTPLAYVDNFYTYRQLCRIVARKHGLIATFMAKPFMGCSANGHHHSISLVDEARRERDGGRPQGPQPPERARRALPRRADRPRRRDDRDRRAERELLQAVLGHRDVGAVPQVVRLRQPLVPLPRPAHVGDRGARRWTPRATRTSPCRPASSPGSTASGRASTRATRSRGT